MSAYVIETAKGKWEIICGLEIHCQIISKSKMYSGASTEYGADPNENVSFIDAGMPGMLPTLNKECVHQAVKTGLGLNAVINKYSAFPAKTIFMPICRRGIRLRSSSIRLSARERLQLIWKTERPRISALSGCILSRMPANPFMILIRRKLLLT